MPNALAHLVKHVAGQLTTAVSQQDTARRAAFSRDVRRVSQSHQEAASALQADVQAAGSLAVQMQERVRLAAVQRDDALTEARRLQVPRTSSPTLLIFAHS